MGCDCKRWRILVTQVIHGGGGFTRQVLQLPKAGDRIDAIATSSGVSGLQIHGGRGAGQADPYPFDTIGAVRHEVNLGIDVPGQIEISGTAAVGVDCAITFEVSGAC